MGHTKNQGDQRGRKRDHTIAPPLMLLKTTHPDRYATLRAQIMDRVRGAGL